MLMTHLKFQFALAFSVMLLLAGCGAESNVLWKDVEQLKQENTDLSLKVQSLQSENTQLTEQVSTLTGLKKETRLQALDTLETIHITKRSGLYDLNEDGTKETLAVYLEPRDTAQDTVKAAGTVHVELWNLNADPERARIADWTLEPQQLQTLWGGTIFASYYRLAFDISDILSTPPTELTVKVTFTDYLSGKVMGDQLVIAP